MEASLNEKLSMSLEELAKKGGSTRGRGKGKFRREQKAEEGKGTRWGLRHSR